MLGRNSIGILPLRRKFSNVESVQVVTAWQTKLFLLLKKYIKRCIFENVCFGRLKVHYCRTLFSMDYGIWLLFLLAIGKYASEVSGYCNPSSY